MDNCTLNNSACKSLVIDNAHKLRFCFNATKDTERNHTPSNITHLQFDMIDFFHQIQLDKAIFIKVKFGNRIRMRNLKLKKGILNTKKSNFYSLCMHLPISCQKHLSKKIIKTSVQSKQISMFCLQIKF